MGATRREITTMVLLPGIVPWVFSGVAHRGALCVYGGGAR